jgi:hypothetical protein
VRESAQLIQRRRRVILQLVEELLGAVWVCFGRLFDESSLDRNRHETLLRTVVKVALDAPPLFVCGGNQARA